MKVRILSSAYLSILDGFDFYEALEPGLGVRFLDSIMADIRSLNISGGGHQIVHKNYRRKVCKTFPYSIYYNVERAEIRVYRVLDNRRDPKWIEGRLD